MDADFRLLSQMKRGEEEAIECFVRKYYPSILQYCHYHLQERKQREIAKILGIGLPLVKYRIRKARELLAQFLRKEAP